MFAAGQEKKPTKQVRAPFRAVERWVRCVCCCFWLDAYVSGSGQVGFMQPTNGGLSRRRNTQDKVEESKPQKWFLRFAASDMQKYDTLLSPLCIIIPQTFLSPTKKVLLFVSISAVLIRLHFYNKLVRFYRYSYETIFVLWRSECRILTCQSIEGRILSRYVE